jgi:hypothetical protein
VLAFNIISGIITTNLVKTATFNEVTGRERRVHHSKSLPLLFTGERFFFGPDPGPDFPDKLAPASHFTALLSRYERPHAVVYFGQAGNPGGAH